VFHDALEIGDELMWRRMAWRRSQRRSYWQSSMPRAACCCASVKDR